MKNAKRAQKIVLSVKYLGEEINNDEFTSQILNKFRSDETGKLCQSDPVVVRLGKSYGQNLQEKNARFL